MTDAAAQSSGRPQWRVFVGLAAAVAIVDQVTKDWLRSLLEPRQSVEVFGDWVRLVHAQNAGGLFGLFQGQVSVFALVSIVVVGLLIAYHARAGDSRYTSITLGLLLGGAIGNLTDRLRLGYVVDFVDLGIGDLRWYTFNVADTAISFALLLLIAGTLRPQLLKSDG